jgi:hypothetical protein
MIDPQSQMSLREQHVQRIGDIDSLKKNEGFNRYLVPRIQQHMNAITDRMRNMETPDAELVTLRVQYNTLKTVLMSPVMDRQQSEKFIADQEEQQQKRENPSQGY